MASIYISGQESSMVRPGTYYRVVSGDVAISGSTQGVVAAMFQSNWGSGEVKDLTVEDYADLEDYYGSGATFLREIFKGGAQTIRAVRVNSESTDADAYSSVTLVGTKVAKDGALGNVDGMVRIVARYAGARAFSVTVNNKILTDQRQVTIYSGTTIFQQVTFDEGDDEGAKLINALANNEYFYAERVVTEDGTAPGGLLANVVQKEFTAGKTPTQTAEQYSKIAELLEGYKWNVLVATVNGAAAQEILIDYVKQSYEMGHFGMLVLAGLMSTDLADRMAFAQAINDWRVCYLINGWTDISGKVYTGYIAAARLAGMIAGCPSNQSITHLTIANATGLTETLSSGNVVRAEQKGCLVLTLNDDGQVWLDNAVTTLTTLGNDQDKGWTKIRRTKTRFELMERVNRTVDNLIGRLNNDDDGRATIVAAAQSIINEMIAESKLQTGSTVALDPAHRSVADKVYLLFTIYDIDSIEQVFETFTFSYSGLS